MQKDEYIKTVWLKKRADTQCSNRVLFNIAVPVILASASVTLLNIIDTIMLGQYNSTALASVGIAGTAFGILGVFAAAASVGINALIAQSLGANDEKSAGRYAWTGIISGFVLGLFVTILWFFLNEPVLKFLGAKEELFSQANTYLSIVKFTIVFGIAAGMWKSILNANSFTKPLLIHTIIINIIHVILNIILIYGKFGFPELGVKGAAVSTLVSSLIGFLYIIRITVVHRKKLQLQYIATPEEMFDSIPRVVKYSMPTLIEWGIWTLGIFFVNKYIVEYGPKQLALYHICMKVQGLFMLALSGFTSASLTLVGRSYGAKNAYYVYAWNKRILAISLTIVSIGMLTCFLFPRNVLMIFLKTVEIDSLGVNISLIMALNGILLPLRTINVVSSSGLRAVGDISYFMKVQPFGLFIVVFLSWYFLSYIKIGIVGVFYAMMIDEAVRAVLIILRFKNLAYRFFLSFHTDDLKAVV